MTVTFTIPGAVVAFVFVMMASVVAFSIAYAVQSWARYRWGRP